MQAGSIGCHQHSRDAGREIVHVGWPGNCCPNAHADLKTRATNQGQGLQLCIIREQSAAPINAVRPFTYIRVSMRLNSKISRLLSAFKQPQHSANLARDWKEKNAIDAADTAAASSREGICPTQHLQQQRLHHIRDAAQRQQAGSLLRELPVAGRSAIGRRSTVCRIVHPGRWLSGPAASCYCRWCPTCISCTKTLSSRAARKPFCMLPSSMLFLQSAHDQAGFANPLCAVASIHGLCCTIRWHGWASRLTSCVLSSQD